MLAELRSRLAYFEKMGEQQQSTIDQLSRSLAVQQVANEGDMRYVPDLIELLDDRDESVRLVASGALTQMTRRESDYKAFAPRASRLEAMDAWRAWYESDLAGQGAQP